MDELQFVYQGNSPTDDTADLEHLNAFIALKKTNKK